MFFCENCRLYFPAVRSKPSRCPACQENEIVYIERDKVKVSAYDYLYHSQCYACHKTKLVSSGTGCCVQCDEPKIL